MVIRRIIAVALGCFLLTGTAAPASKNTGLTRITVSNDDKAASAQVHDWLQARGFDVSVVNGVLSITGSLTHVDELSARKFD
jgi:hypothetical protein